MTSTPENVISSQRLELIPMAPEFLEASLSGRRALAAQILGLQVPPDWFSEQALVKLRLEQLRRDPGLQTWLLRAVGLKESRVMAGHIGFHTRPGPEYLNAIAPGGIEFGYTIFPAYRRQGYAREACLALMHWAHFMHQVERFVVTISPHNLASLRLAEGIGFVRTGEHVDPQDGLEYIFERRLGESDRPESSTG